MEWQALGVSLRLATGTSLLLVALGIPLAYWISFGRGWGRKLVEAAVTLPLFLPPTVLGFFLLSWMGPHGWMGRLVAGISGQPLAFRFSGLVLASCLYSLPFGVLPLVIAFRGMDRAYWEASRTLGVGPWETFLRVILPLSWPAVFLSAVLTFAHTMGEFGVALMVGGNIPGKTRTLSIALYDCVEALEFRTAQEIAFWLLGISVLVLWVTFWLQERSIQSGKKALLP
ncbi:molybdate ABC transporter permease subunit [Candidatus Methylacidithermus pantelleriae]|uniref:Molybdenum transport system permease n=1 Tax=Candidatus Methylacidithermus pantelleriae TaxID=2744239 RepID=A0A8J2BFT0_9BACT|nr:molybdate ABC transporter permease subunit [Candidatus Methylacidithermus pantelleriae]CAF0689384.1 Molybdenum transport system permease protein ModB [Candidatus Methylacidithermus pantelleriae]